MELALIIVYFAILVVLSLYGGHRLFIAYLYHRYRDRRPVAPGQFETPPRVAIQLPVFNERYVAERLVRTVAAIRYPAERLEIQVLDDSTDDTSQIVAAVVAELASAGVPIRHVRRPDREGYKAGALAYGLSGTEAELVAVFDADFLPGPDFLETTVPHFTDPEVGMVQVRWDHVNRSFSRLTRAQAVLLDGHFVVEHTARNRSGRFFNFNGTAGIWRRAAIEESGGWQHDTLTEDLDLSFRAQQRGWRFVFLNEPAVPAELPVDMAAFKSQQHRWAKGSIQTARKLLGGVLRSSLPRAVKLEALFQLTANAAYLLMALLSLLMPLTLFVRIDRGWAGSLAMDLPLFLLATVAVCNFYALSQRELGRGLLEQVRHLPLVLALGIGMSLNNGRAVLEALIGHKSGFVRTPKYDVRGRKDRWHGKNYVHFRWIQPILELALGLWFTPAILFAIEHGGRSLLALPFLVLFQFGYLYVGFLSIGQILLGIRARRVATS